MDKQDQIDWDQLTEKQGQFVLNRLKKMSRVDAYMDAYGMESREVAKTAACRLMSTNVNVKAILDKHFADCVEEAKAILKVEAPEAASQVVEILHMGNREYDTRLKAAMYLLKTVGVEEPVKKAVELSGGVEQVIRLKRCYFAGGAG